MLCTALYAPYLVIKLETCKQRPRTSVKVLKTLVQRETQTTCLVQSEPATQKRVGCVCGGQAIRLVVTQCRGRVPI